MCLLTPGDYSHSHSSRKNGGAVLIYKQPHTLPPRVAEGHAGARRSSRVPGQVLEQWGGTRKRREDSSREGVENVCDSGRKLAPHPPPLPPVASAFPPSTRAENGFTRMQEEMGNNHTTLLRKEAEEKLKRNLARERAEQLREQEGKGRAKVRDKSRCESFTQERGRRCSHSPPPPLLQHLQPSSRDLRHEEVLESLAARRRSSVSELLEKVQRGSNQRLREDVEEFKRGYKELWRRREVERENAARGRDGYEQFGSFERDRYGRMVVGETEWIRRRW